MIKVYFQIELDVTICKTYNYMMKAMKSEPYFVATHEGKFSSKCDEALLSHQQAAAATSRATPKAKTEATSTSTSTTTPEVTEEPTSPAGSSSSTSEETQPEVDETPEEATKEATSAATSATTSAVTEEDSETTASEDHKLTTPSEATHSTDATESTEGEVLGNNVDDDPKESVRSNVDSGITVPGETTISTTFSAADVNATATEVEVNTSIITLSTSEIDSTDKGDHMEGKTAATEAETDGETTSGQTTGTETDTTAAETTLGETTLGETTLGETTHGDTTMAETTHSETVTTAGTEASDDKMTTAEHNAGEKEGGRMDSVMKEKEVSLSFEVSNETSSIEGSMIKRGRILMGDDSNDEQESSRSAEKARALQFNPWGKNSAESSKSFRSVTAVIAAATFLSLALVA